LDELRKPENIHHFSYMEEFFAAARKGTLPNYVFLEPAYFGSKEKGFPAQDQHPDHSIRAGEGLLKSVYEALRTSPQWEESLLLVTYDEHGGFFDHVPPPGNLPNPDGLKPTDVSPVMQAPPFNFDRAGVRIPFIAISPWIDKQVVHAPPQTAKPKPNSGYEHSSILATLGKLFPQLGSKALLTDRVKWAATFEHLINRKTPRTDCPTNLPNVAPQTATELQTEWNQELSHLQQDLLGMAGKLTGSAEFAAAKLKGEASALINKAFAPFLNKVWTDAKSTLGTLVDDAKKGYRELEQGVTAVGAAIRKIV
jgi:phospholipase C